MKHVKRFARELISAAWWTLPTVVALLVARELSFAVVITWLAGMATGIELKRRTRERELRYARQRGWDAARAYAARLNRVKKVQPWTRTRVGSVPKDVRI